ncbi:uncharacterized protein PV06_00935 [Exophiala oligosperma]|uniref:Uncharacterized protein n=2 Tax=Chaetothyriales TaxID=34395 RepID=A0A0D2B7X4_9EURO|nr:uncharacterized protein PV06_00935 [Exophiala oligosperma]KAJ9633237.1 hypothetical protein H2204_007133 [Knufia peltigerae]KIW48336.1 hypothetical protein PV06_00935 [Exophiala oligosperma]
MSGGGAPRTIMPGSGSECEIGAAVVAKPAELECQVTPVTGLAPSDPNCSSSFSSFQDTPDSEMLPMPHAHDMAKGKGSYHPNSSPCPSLETFKNRSSAVAVAATAAAAPTTQKTVQSSKASGSVSGNSTPKASSLSLLSLLSSFSENCCALLLRLINVLLTAAENLAKDKYLIFLLIILALGAVVWYCLAWVDGWAASSVRPARLAWAGVSTTFGFLVNHITKLGDIVPLRNVFSPIATFTQTLGSSAERGGLISTVLSLGELVTDPSTYKDLLCASQVALCLAPWLSFCSHPKYSPNSSSASETTTTTTAPTTSLVVFNETGVELGEFAGVAVSLYPYIADFQLSSVPLTRERFLLRYYEGVQFAGRTPLLSNMLLYRDELYNSNQCLWNITVHTNRILRVMIANFETVAEVVTKAEELDRKSWWGLSRAHKSQVIDRIVGLLEVLDQQLLHLIENIDGCQNTLVLTADLSQEVEGGLMTASRDVGQQIQKASGLFKKPDGDLLAISRVLSETTRYAASEAREILEVARIKLGDHRRDVLNAKETLDLSLILSSKNGLVQLASMLQAVLGDLSNDQGKVQLAQKRHREGFDKKSRPRRKLFPH